MIQGSQLQQNSLHGNSLASFTNTGFNVSGSLGSTIPQSLHKVERGEVTMIVGGQNSSSAVCLGGGRALSRFSVCPSSVQEVRASPLGFVVFCRSGLIKLFNATCHLVYSFSLRPYSTVAVLSSPDNVTSTAYINRRGNLVRYEFGGGSITLYTRSGIESTFGTCSARWSLRTYNKTHFIFECPSSKRYLVNGFTSNSNKVVLNGSLFINSGADEAVIINGDHSFTFYWSGFSSPCTINVPLSTSLLTGPTNIDFGKNNGQTVIVLFTSNNIFIFDTSRGCRDEFLQKLNISYPCVAGDCDGYFILDDKRILAVNKRSSNKLTLDLFHFNNTIPHIVTNLQELPDVLNVNKSVTESQIPTSTTQVVSSMILSQTMTSTSITMASSTPSLLTTPSSMTSTSTLLLPSSTNPLPSSTLLPKAKTSLIALYVFLAIAVIIMTTLTCFSCCAIVLCVANRKQKGTKISICGVSMVHSPSTSTSSTEDPSDIVIDIEPREETGLTTLPIPVSSSTNSFGDYKRPTPEKSNPKPTILV